MRVKRVMRVLALGAHTDDIELGCGGAIARHVERGNEVYCLAMSSLDNPTLIQECTMAMAALGVPYSNLTICHFPNKLFHARRQGVFDFIEEMVEHVQPHVIYTHHTRDSHQDHEVVTQEVIRVVKHRPMGVLGYELLPNLSSATLSLPCFAVLEAVHLGRKIVALECYDSQSGKPYMQPDMLMALAMIRGLQAGVGWAEAFEVIRMVFQ